MSNDLQHSSRISGGLLGVIALALAGSGAGVVGYWAFGGSETEEVSPTAQEILADNSIEISETTAEQESRDDEAAYETVDGPDRLPAETGTIVDDPPPPSVPPRVEPKPQTTPPAFQGRILKDAAFIVRFNNVPELEAPLKQFRTSKSESRAAFAKWAAKHPELDGLTLERVNYSGEVILNYRGADDANPARTAKEIQARLNELSFVRYADPDFTAFPGKGE